MDGLPASAGTGRTRVEDAPHASRGVSLRDTVREATRQLEAEIIREALERHRWNRRRTAEALKISYRSLMYKMKYCRLRDGAAPDVDRNGESGEAV